MYVCMLGVVLCDGLRWQLLVCGVLYSSHINRAFGAQSKAIGYWICNQPTLKLQIVKGAAAAAAGATTTTTTTLDTLGA